MIIEYEYASRYNSEVCYTTQDRYGKMLLKTFGRIEYWMNDYGYSLHYKYNGTQIAMMYFDNIREFRKDSPLFLPAVDLVAVHPKYRNAGIARKLYACLLENVSDTKSIASGTSLTPVTYSMWMKFKEPFKYIYNEDTFKYEKVEGFSDPKCFEESVRLIISRSELYAYC